MKKISWSIIVLTILLSACGSPAPATEAATVPATPEESIVQLDPDVVIASAVAEPVQVSELGFTINALIKEIPVAKGDTVSAGETLMVLNTPDLEFAVIAGEEDYKSKALAAELQKAEKVLDVNPNTGNRRWYSLPNEVYLKAVAVADQSKAVWDSAAASFAQSTLTAPFDGTVVDLYVLPGGSVQANQTVLVLANLEHLQITTTDLNERDITRVKVGQKVDVIIEALGQTISGRVIRIAPEADIVGGDVVFPVTIQLDEQPDSLLWGMTAEVHIQTK